MEIQEKLQAAFPALTQDSAQHIAARCRFLTLAKNRILFTEGAAGNSFFLLTEGMIKIFKTAPDGQEMVLNILTSDVFFAEVIPFGKDQYPVCARAIAETRIIEIPRGPFLQLLDEPNFRNEFIAALMQKQRFLTERILYLTSYDVEERFFRFLLEHYGSKSEYHLDISKKEIAAAIGTIPETLSRLFERLRKNNIIHWQGHRLMVDHNYLENFDTD